MFPVSQNYIELHAWVKQLPVWMLLPFTRFPCYLIFLGCQEIAEEFRSQEIDGQALLLLKEEHLMSAMNIKLGPALKICAKINILKDT